MTDEENIYYENIDIEKTGEKIKELTKLVPDEAKKQRKLADQIREKVAKGEQEPNIVPHLLDLNANFLESIKKILEDTESHEPTSIDREILKLRKEKSK